MTHPADTKNSPAEVVRAVQDCVSQAIMGDPSAAARLFEFYAEPTYVLHPMRPDIPPLITRDDFRRHAAAIADGRGRPDSHRAVDVVIHATTDPEVVVTEFRYETIQNGTTMITPCVWVTRVRDGRIVEARDYNGDAHPSEPSAKGTG
jgi:ketosteroid isomerase-like protein